MIKTAIRSFMGGGTLPILLVVGAVALFVSGYTKGRIDGSQKALVEQLTKEKEELTDDRDRLQKQIEGANDALKSVQEQSDLDAKKIESLKGKVDAFDKGLGPKSDRFILGDDDVKRLRGN